MSCYDIRFNRPNKTQISKRILAITTQEGLVIEPKALDLITEASGNDIRQVFTMLEMWTRSCHSFTLSDAKVSEHLYQKDSQVMINNFDAASMILKREEMAKRRFREKMNLFFIDMDLIPLLIHENYLTAMGCNTESKNLERMTEASESIAFGDVISKHIRTQGDWSMLQAYGLASAIDPGLRSGLGVPFPKFPEWLGRNSGQKKFERLLQEVRAATATSICAENEDIISDYIPLLYSLILAPLKDMGKDGVNESVEIMEAYNLTPEHIKEHLIQLQLDSAAREEEFKSLPTPVKTALTRVYNASRAVTQQSKGRKKQLLAEAPEPKADSEGENAEADAEMETDLPGFD
jgi:replication factor C subunit 1